MGTKSPYRYIKSGCTAAAHGSDSRAEADSPRVKVMDIKSQSTVGMVTAISASGFNVQHVRVTTQNGFNIGWQGAPHYVALHDLHMQDCEIFADDAPVARERDLRGRLAYIPSKCRSGGWMLPRATPQAFTALFLDPAGLEEDLARRLRQLPQRARVYFYDEPLKATLGKLRDCLLADTPPDRMYVESLCMLATMELCRIPALQEGATGGLGSLVAERVIDYMDANLGQDMSLEDLARVAGLSRFHFVRAFRRATHDTPYQHLLRRRIERAQTLLRESDVSIAEIALAVGFKDASRFTAAFRRMLNCSPRAFRDAAALRHAG